MTEPLVQIALVAGKAPSEIADPLVPGLQLRLSRRGVVTFSWRQRIGGRQRRLTVGHYPSTSLEDARAQARVLNERVAAGEDPWEEERAQKLDVSTLCQLYLERHAKPKKRSWKDDERRLRKQIIPAIGALKVRHVSRADIRKVIASAEKRGRIEANRVYALLRTLFVFAISIDALEEHPMHHMFRPFDEPSRERTLENLEIKTLWKALERSATASSRALQFQLLTGQRTGEVLRMEWGEVSAQEPVWTIPAERHKSKRAHRVPLSRFARRIIGSQNGARRVFRGADTTTLGRTIRSAGFTDVRPMDLRRTAASRMAQLGFDRLILDKVLGHVERGVIAVYDRYSYETEKRAALDAWASELGRIVGDTALSRFFSKFMPQ